MNRKVASAVKARLFPWRHGKRTRAVQSLLNRGDAARDARQWRDAAEAYRQYLDIQPDAFGIWVQYGHALKESERFAEAAAAYDRALAIHADNSDLHLNYGHLHKMRGKLDEAVNAYQKSYRLDANMLARGELIALGQTISSSLLEEEGKSGLKLPMAGVPVLVLPFTGSEFSEFSTSDPLEILRLMARNSTSAVNLARTDPHLLSPRISLIVPIYNTPLRFLHEMVHSVQAQTYENWEMCLVDDGSTIDACKAALAEIVARGDDRITLRTLERNVGIAQASQQALQMTTGDYVAFVDHDDLITPNALSEVVAVLRNEPSIDYVYTDHCMVDEDGIPKYYARKPAWSPDFLLSTNYIVHLKVVRRSLLFKIGGLSHELANVQDLGMSLRLARAGARVHHLPKICYHWRDHHGSVASTAGAKPGIEDLMIETYDRHLAAGASGACQTWPARFQNSGIGVFKLEFPIIRSTVAVLILMRGTGVSCDDIASALLPDKQAGVSLHFIAIGAETSTDGVIALRDDTALSAYVQELDCDHVAIVNSTARSIGIDWLRELVGYLELDPAIGIVGGKTLDSYLRVKAGGLLLDGAEHYRMIGGGRFDNAPSHWFIGQIASNVDAVSSALLAARRTVIMESGGVPFACFGDAAGVPFSAAARRLGHRIVYNPSAKLFDPCRLVLPARWSEDWRDPAGGRGAPSPLYPEP